MRVAFETKDGMRSIDFIMPETNGNAPRRIRRPMPHSWGGHVSFDNVESVSIPVRTYHLHWECPEWMREHCSILAIYREA